MKKLFCQYLLYCSVIFIALVGCNSKQTISEKISSMENQLYTNEGFNASIADELLLNYKKYADNFPDDSLSPKYLFKAGEVAINAKRYEQAITFLDKAYSNYPKYNKKVDALFLEGFVYDNYLHQKDLAKECYEKLIKLYPEHHFADDAEIAIKTLYMTDEQIIEMFKGKEKPLN